jgi:2-methylcitrate dehydratase PrpD
MLARDLVKALRGSWGAPPPPEVDAIARLHFVDAIGVGVAAAGSAVGEPYLRYAAELGAGGASIFGHARGVSAADAAFVNGGLIHSLEFDDTHLPSIVHGSSALAAAALASAEAAGASGHAMLAAYSRGWEVLVRFGLASPGRYQARGFQITSIGGALAAALVAAELNGLSEDQAVAALGIGLAQASGVLEVLSGGATVKSLLPGRGASGGVVAAALARAGMTGPESTLEGRFGLFRAFAGDEEAAARFGALVKTLGETWYLREAAFKLYPCCHFLHSFIEAAGELASRMRPEDMERILCRVPAAEAPIICEPWERMQSPPTAHAARWSLPIVVAARIVEGKVDLDTFERPASDAVRAFARRIAWEPLPDTGYPKRFDAEIVCGAHRVRVDDVEGSPPRGASRERVMAKFRANAARLLPDGEAASLARAVETLAPASEIGAIIRRNPRSKP